MPNKLMRFYQKLSFGLIFITLAQPLALAQSNQPKLAPKLGVEKLPETFSCKRSFVYEGQILTCDSSLHRDGENLRTIIEPVPEAIKELNLYQSNRRKISSLAYVGTLGILSILTGAIFSGTLTKNSDDANRLRKILILSGTGILGGSVLIGASILESNERHLEEAVKLYNQARPKNQIQLQFSTEFTF